MAMSRMSGSIPVVSLSHVNVPTREEATVAVAQVRDALDSIYLSSHSMRARAAAGIHVNDRPMVAFKLLTESTEAQEAIADMVSNPEVFNPLRRIFQENRHFQNIVQKIQELATSCLLPSDRQVPTEDDEISSFADRASGWVRMFNMVVDVVSSVWNRLVDLFASAIPRIQAAFARENGASGDQYALEATKVVTGLVVLVIAIIIAGATLAL